MDLIIDEPADPVLARLLQSHPHVQLTKGSEALGIQFQQGQWHREVHAGRNDIELHGLVELMDNNPLVCADEASVPDQVGTLGLIAFGPVFRAGVVAEDPVLQTNAIGTGEGFWATEGWTGEVDVNHEDMDLGSVVSATGICIVNLTNDSIRDLYEEAFGRSFYVRACEEGDWDTSVVSDRPWAVYRLRLTGDDDRKLLTVQVMADTDGKCGAAQLVHAMNVMAGFEESLGIPETLRFV